MDCLSVFILLCVSVCVSVSLSVCVSVYLCIMSSECVLSGLSNNRQCFNFGLPRLVFPPSGRGHIVAATTVMSLVKPQPDNLSCYVMWQLWTKVTRMVNW